jgi:hypothetical protein
VLLISDAWAYKSRGLDKQRSEREREREREEEGERGEYIEK